MSEQSKDNNAKAEKADKNVYKDTLNLPKTDFDMKANLLAKEPAIQARWRRRTFTVASAASGPAPSGSSCTTARPTPTATSMWARR